MKRITIILLALLLCLGACQQAAPPNSPADEPQVNADEQTPSMEEAPEPEPADLPPIPMDAAMYRGAITAFAVSPSLPEAMYLTLEQAPGTDFGAEQLMVLIDEDTRTNFEVAQLVEGSYLEVYYGSAGGVPPKTEALTAILLPDADLCLFNGVVQTVTPDEEKEGEGVIALNSLEDKGEILFHYNGETQFYLDFAALSPGDELNVYFNGITTRSLPPQATALEVRPYAPPKEPDAASQGEDSPAGTIETVAEPASYPASAESVTVTLTNHSGEELGLGLHYQIQRKTDSGWEKLPLEFAVIEIALLVPDGESATQTFSLHRDQYEYTPGTYRILWQNQEELAAEFTLT